MKVVNFPDPRLQEFVAEVRREGSAHIDLASKAEVKPFRQAIRRAFRQLGLRVRTGSGNALDRDDDGHETWTYGQRVWAYDPNWQPTPEQKFRRLALQQGWDRKFSSLDQR